MTMINKKYPMQCSYFDKLIFTTMGIRKNGKIVHEFYHKCTLREDICKRAVKLDMPLFDAEKICVVKKRD